MLQDFPLITTVVAGLVLAFGLGLVAKVLRMPPLLGYLLAGIVVALPALGLAIDPTTGAVLAELGIVLLMFGIGMQFSLKDILQVRVLAIVGGLLQIAVATALGLVLAIILGWDIIAGIVFGLALSFGSTVLVFRTLQDKRLLDSERGRSAINWLIVQNLVAVLALVLLPAFAASNAGGLIHDPFVSFVERMAGMDIGMAGALGLTLVKVAAFVGFMLIVGRRAIPWALRATARSGSRELFRLAVLAIGLGVALGSAVLFGVPLALGAFLAGLMLAEHEPSQRTAQDSLPLREAYAVLFFVGIGMLFDPSILLRQPLQVLGTVLIVIVARAVVAFGIMTALRRPQPVALTVSAGLAQIGEFSFILASLGVTLAVLPAEGRDLIVAAMVISIILNPLVFWATARARPQADAEKRMEPGDAAVAADEVAPRKLSDHVVLVGFGRVGQVVGQGLKDAGTPLLVVEDSERRLALARGQGFDVVSGNAASAATLELANLGQAKALMVAIADAFAAGAVVARARKSSPGLRIVARAHSADAAADLRRLGADQVVLGEQEIGLGMLASLRGERGETVVETPVAPVEPKLSPVDNILTKAAAAVAVEPVIVAEPALVEPVVDVSEAVIDLPPAAPVEDVAVIAAVEAAEAPVEPAAVEAAATLESVQATPEQGEAPAEIDADKAEPEVVIPLGPPVAPVSEEAMAVADEISEGGPVGPPPVVEAVPEPAETVVEPVKSDESEVVIPLPPPASVVQEAMAVADEISEGGPVGPPPEPVPAPADKPDENGVPPVAPEPRN